MLSNAYSNFKAFHRTFPFQVYVVTSHNHQALSQLFAFGFMVPHLFGIPHNSQVHVVSMGHDMPKKYWWSHEL